MSLPRLRLMMSAPRSVAQMMPRATSPESPDPASFRTLTGMIDAPGATPATPMPLLAVAAMVPATCVPCEWPSLRPSPNPVKSLPGTNDPARSGWRATPVSMTATTTPVPSTIGQADSALMRSRPQRAARCASLLLSGATTPSITRTSDSNSIASRSSSACWRWISAVASCRVGSTMRSTTGRPFSTLTVTSVAASPGSSSARISAGGAVTDSSGSVQLSATGTGAGASAGTAASAQAGETRPRERMRAAATGTCTKGFDDIPLG